jgi:stage V sporulation protein G
MEITEVQVALADEGKLRAYINITIDDCFMVRGLKVIESAKGIFVAMPNKKGTNGMFRDMAHPINHDTRAMIEEIVLEKYDEAVADEAEDHMSHPVRSYPIA